MKLRDQRDWYLFYCGLCIGILLMVFVMSFVNHIDPQPPAVRTQIVATATGAW